MTFDVYSMGFSNRTWDDTLAILRKFDIHRLVDIRTLPGSKHTPQFNLEHLQQALPEAGIQYFHMKNLGGLRKPLRDSPINAAWRNNSFRGYADYMQSPEFAENVQWVVDLATVERCALMCAEAVPWRCHRSLIGDALLVRGVRVEDIVGPGKRESHTLTTFAHVDGMQITYPPAATPFSESG